MMDDTTTPAPVAGTETVAPAVTATTTSDTAAAPGAELTSLDDAKQLIARLLKDKQDANKEAQKLKERVRTIDEQAEADRVAKLSETDKLREQLARIEGEHKALQITALRAQAAAKHALGDLAEFLTGDTAEDIEKQAVKLAARLKQPPNLAPGATGGVSGNPAPESYSQRMQRIMAGGAGDLANLEAMGGGVHWPTKPNEE